MKKSSLLLLACLYVSSASAQSLLLGRNLFPEGGFDVFGESRLIPSGWYFPDPNDKPWKNGFRVDVVKDTGPTKELRIVNTDFGSTMASSSLTLPPKIELGAADPSGNGAGILIRFRDQSAKSLLAGWVGGTHVKTDNAEWEYHESLFDVPPATASLELHVIFRGAKGEIHVDDVEIVPIGMSA